MFEVEVKAWVDRPEVLERRLEGMAESQQEFDKWDIYFTREEGGRQLFRFRRDGEVNTVTYKKRSRQGALEVNREHEFRVDDQLEFLQFCRHLGYREQIRKHKKGVRYHYRDIGVELAYVEGLGHFVEVEALVDREEELTAAREKVEQVIEDLGIPRERWEGRYYTEMLAQKKAEGKDIWE
ncbi:MAG TPA: class IV adenylate cyclase [Sediminispirochaeta sp.]|nr:class IV adenylate cyclase [Sediminispirochaeta sp.]